MRQRLRRPIKFLISCCFFLVLLGGSLTLHTVHAYAGVCTQVDGFAGFLQRSGFVPSGNCEGEPGSNTCDPGRACSVNGHEGKCHPMARPGGPPLCTCVVNNPSK